jgi:hypothetical protein
MPFEEGKSGNPGGRPKENARIKKAAQVHGDMAIERLAHWAQSDNARASVAAAQALLDRGFGKPEQAHKHSGMIASTHEEHLKQLDSLPDDADGESDTDTA